MKTIMIDPGHGGNDNGATYGYDEEDDINLSISYLLRFVLKEQGFQVYMTREKDEYVSLDSRCQKANAKAVDAFVSIHCDAFHKTTVSGMSLHVFPGSSPATRNLAESIHKSLRARFPEKQDRGIKESNFHVLRCTTMPAVLVECEFISNPETRKWLHEPENQLALAYAIAGGKKEG